LALKATLFKAELTIADLDRHYYHTHPLTLARHPAEDNARMMVRLLAFALNAHQQLQFTRGLCIAEEPALWRHADDGHLLQWIDLGQHNEKRLRRACQRAGEVTVYTYQGTSSHAWWQQLHHKLTRLRNLSVYYLPPHSLEQLVALSQRTMKVTCIVQEGEVRLTTASTSAMLALHPWQVRSSE